MSLNLFYKTEGGKTFNGRVNRFPVHTTFFCYEPSGWETSVGVIAVSEQTTVNDKVPRFQSEVKDSVGYIKKLPFFDCGTIIRHHLLFKKICEGSTTESIRRKVGVIYAL